MTCVIHKYMRKNWAKRQKKKKIKKYRKNTCFLQAAVLKYTTVRQATDRAKAKKDAET